MRNSLRAAAITLSLTLCTATGLARSHHVSGLAPVEVVASGFADLAGLAVDESGNMFVADRRAGTVTRIAPDQRRVTIASHLNEPAGLAFDESGRLLIAEKSAGRVVRLETDGRKTAIVTGLKSPRWLAVDEVGTVYVSARRLSRSGLREFDVDDVDPQVILAWNRTHGLRVFADDFRQLEGLALGEGGLYAVARGRRPAHAGDGTVYRIEIRADGTAGAGAPLAFLERLQRPFGITRDHLGALYVTARQLSPHQHGDDLVVKLRSDGTRSLFASGLDDPQGVAFDGAGNLYVADGDTGRVLRFRAPAPPILEPVAEFTQQTTLVVGGRADRNARITISGGQEDVSTLTQSTGRFSAAVTLASDVHNVLEIFVTPFRGEGLTSMPAEVEITHDDTAPTASFVSPGGGTSVRGMVTVQAEGTDVASGVSTLTLFHGTQPMRATVAPPLPADVVMATAVWDTTVLPDGTHEVSLTVIDRAGNAATAHRQVLVDNTPPETSIVAGPSGGVADSGVTFTVTGIDNLSPPPALQYSWRLDEGTWSAFTALTSITLTGVGQGMHRFEVRARDLAGNEDATPATRSFTVGGLRVTVTSPTPGVTVPAGLVIVRGIVDGMAGEVGVAVNEVAAAVSGNEFAAALFVDAGPALLSVVATGPGGVTALASVPITAVGAAASEGLSASPVSGVAPLTVTFSVFGTADDVSIDLDADGDGRADFTDARLENRPFTFTSPGLYVAGAVITTPGGQQRVVQTVVQVLDRAALDATLQAKWTGMKAALRAGDIAAALEFIVERRRTDYGHAFTILAARLPAVDSIMTDIEFVWMRNAAALYEMVRVDAGITKSFEVRFALGGDGVWRLESF